MSSDNAGNAGDVARNARDVALNAGDVGEWPGEASALRAGRGKGRGRGVTGKEHCLCPTRLLSAGRLTMNQNQWDPRLFGALPGQFGDRFRR